MGGCGVRACLAGGAVADDGGGELQVVPGQHAPRCLQHSTPRRHLQRLRPPERGTLYPTRRRLQLGTSRLHRSALARWQLKSRWENPSSHRGSCTRWAARLAARNTWAASSTYTTSKAPLLPCRWWLSTPVSVAHTTCRTRNTPSSAVARAAASYNANASTIDRNRFILLILVNHEGRSETHYRGPTTPHTAPKSNRARKCRRGMCTL